MSYRLNGGCADAAEVAAGARLGQPQAAEDLPLRQRHEPTLLLRLRAVQGERFARQPQMRGDDQTRRAAALLISASISATLR